MWLAISGMRRLLRGEVSFYADIVEEEKEKEKEEGGMEGGKVGR